MSGSPMRIYLWGALFLVLVLMVTGCRSPARTQEPTATPSRQTTTPAVAKLDVLKIVVEHHGQGGPPTYLTPDVRVDIHENDQVKVLDQGRARLDFQGVYEVELFRGAEVDVEEIRVEDGFVFTILRHLGDHGRVMQKEDNGRFKMVTAYATITPSESDTEVVVCHDETLTCIAAIKGTTEVEAQGQVRTLKEGESTYVLKGQPPEPIVCSDQAEFREWLDKKRGTEEVEPLGALVQRWSQKPCPREDDPSGQEPGAQDPSVVVPRPDSALTCKVIARALNLRDAPSTSYGRRIGLLRYGDHFVAEARNAEGTWIEGHVQRSDQTGWVYARYVSCDGSTADLPQGE